MLDTTRSHHIWECPDHTHPTLAMPSVATTICDPDIWEHIPTEVANAGPNAVQPDTETACNCVKHLLVLDRMPWLVPPQVLVNCCTISDPLLKSVFVASNVFFPSITAVVPSGSWTRTVLPNVTITGIADGSLLFNCKILHRIAVLTKSNRETCWTFFLLFSGNIYDKACISSVFFFYHI